MTLSIEFDLRVASAGYLWADGRAWKDARVDGAVPTGGPFPQWRVRAPWNQKGNKTPLRLLRATADSGDAQSLPLDDPALFRNFAALDPMSDHVVRFANTYGLLWESDLGVPFAEWEYEIRTMRFLLRIFDYVRERKPIHLDCGHVVRFPSERPTPLFRELARYTRYADHHSVAIAYPARQARQPIQEAAHDFLVRAVNARLGVWCPLPALNRQGKQAQLSLQPQTLLGALWLQFAIALAENKTYRQCVACGRYMEISPGANRADRRTCSNVCRNRELRRRQALARSMSARGKSIREIMKAIGSDSATIRGWVDSE